MSRSARCSPTFNPADGSCWDVAEASLGADPKGPPVMSTTRSWQRCLGRKAPTMLAARYLGDLDFGLMSPDQRGLAPRPRILQSDFTGPTSIFIGSAPRLAETWPGLYRLPNRCMRNPVAQPRVGVSCVNLAAPMKKKT